MNLRHSLNRSTYLSLLFSLVVTGTVAVRSVAGTVPARRSSARPTLQEPAVPAGSAGVAWVRTIPTASNGEEYGWDVKFDSSGHVVAAGSATEFWNGYLDHAFVIGRWSPGGDQLWPSPQAPLKSLFHGTALSVELDSQDNVISGGTRISGQGMQLVVTKRSPAGTEYWTKGVGSSIQSSARGMQVGIDGHDDIFAVGTRFDNNLDRDFYVVKLSGATGDVIWERQIDSGQSYHEGRALVVDRDGNVLVGGAFYTEADDTGFRVLKLSGATGATLWSQAIDGTGSGGGEQVNSLALDQDGNVIAGGSVNSGDEGGFTVAMLAGATGEPLWTRYVNPPASVGYGMANDVTVDAQGNVIAVGMTYSAEERNQFTLVKLNGKTGAILWSDFRKGDGASVTLDRAGNVYATGQFYPTSNGVPQILGAWTPTGALSWSLGLPHDGSVDLSFGQSVAVDPAGNVAITGTVENGVSLDFMVAYVDRVSPILTAETATPQSLPSSGGTVSFHATAADNTGLKKVVAVATRPGEVIEIPLQANGNGEYTGQLTLPKNTSVSDQVYTTQVVITDLSGNVTYAESGNVTVHNGAGRLVVNPKVVQFPRTSVGATSTRVINLRNSGKGQLSCTLSVSAPFSLVDAPATSGTAGSSLVTLVLAPGTRMQVPIAFLPQVPGVVKGTLEITSTDPKNSRKRVPVKGKAQQGNPTN